MIIRHKPEIGLDEAEQAWFDSDAPDNAQAIREINAEAAKYGLVRTREYWLQQFSFEGKPVFRGFCFRMEPSSIGNRLAEARLRDAVGISSTEIVRTMRDNET